MTRYSANNALREIQTRLENEAAPKNSVKNAAMRRRKQAQTSMLTIEPVKTADPELGKLQNNMRLLQTIHDFDE